ncbi:foldase protein PrsA [Hyphobacterium sp.]|uniref:foldase protein PrsA n=1 Tax=Hyphobacterium sp. TaxID=2004662 RepID=UPI003BAAF576
MKRGCYKWTPISRFAGLILAAGLAACGSPAPEPVETDELALPDNAAARVGETIIYNSSVQREALAQGVIAEGERLGEGDADYERIVDELIDQRLLAIEARRRGLQQSPEARRRLAAAEERILGNILLETEIAANVTDESARRIYSEQTELARPGEQIRARHILVATEDAAEAIIGLAEDGRDFAELAIQYSEDIATRVQGGDLGYFTRDGVLAEISDVAFSTAEGEMAGPIQTEAGWHVLLIIDRRAPEGPSFDEVRPSIVRFLTYETISTLVENLREETRIEVIAADLPEPAGEPAEPETDADGLADTDGEIEN